MKRLFIWPTVRAFPLLCSLTLATTDLGAQTSVASVGLGAEREPGPPPALVDPWLTIERDWRVPGRPALQDSRTSESSEPRNPARASLLNAGVGFTIDPGTLLLFGEVDVPVAEHSYIGPLVQMGVSDDRFMLGPAAAFRHEFTVPDLETSKVVPWVQAGAGLLYAHRDRRRGSDDDLGLLLLVGGGIEFRFTDRMAARFGLLIDILPIDVFGDHLFLSVELLSLTFRL